MRNIVIASWLGLSFFLVHSQEQFKDLEFLIGKWQGVESGVAGNGIGFRTYNFDLDDNFIIEKNRSTFPKSEKKPIGEVHRDFGVYSYNSVTSIIVFRQFHVEGFTIVYQLNKTLSVSDKFVFISREIENSPKDWIARSVITKISNDEFIETFEIAMDGVN